MYKYGRHFGADIMPWKAGGIGSSLPCHCEPVRHGRRESQSGIFEPPSVPHLSGGVLVGSKSKFNSVGYPSSALSMGAMICPNSSSNQLRGFGVVEALNPSSFFNSLEPGFLKQIAMCQTRILAHHCTSEQKYHAPYVI